MGLLVLPEEFKSVKIEECKNMKGSYRASINFLAVICLVDDFL
ncbi:hypothetical protein GCHA_0094 [Paraglaciecola chathamensis S18K6]|uniref:Transposase n=1 Tax=Paraglaciecola chathamensis S18K6 TaxID=1127672 RepID=A0AAV3USE1_9ALTE|nr:hypothetical protein GCHA_0094 [Paraglaciecola chathamensis S18K6]